jgi:D-3-phosphoglycerate dehydrogenase
LRGHDLAITALETVDEYLLSKLPELQAIGKYGVGLDMIDLSAMRKYGKRLGWVRGVNRRSVSEITLAFAITLLRKVITANREVVGGTWRQHVGGQLTGRTIGIIGCGSIGQDLVQLLKPFECKIFANDIVKYQDFYAQHHIEPASLEVLLKNSDIVSMHVPLDNSTRGLIGAKELAQMKSSAILINTARGGLVDENALKNALLNNALAGAAFDVFNNEPPLDNELLTLPNFLATPHIGGSAEEAILAMGLSAIDGLENGIIPPEVI